MSLQSGSSRTNALMFLPRVGSAGDQDRGSRLVSAGNDGVVR
jgi:hypothetical protein